MEQELLVGRGIRHRHCFTALVMMSMTILDRSFTIAACEGVTAKPDLILHPQHSGDGPRKKCHPSRQVSCSTIITPSVHMFRRFSDGSYESACSLTPSTKRTRESSNMPPPLRSGEILSM